MGRLCPARCQPALGVRAQNGSFHGHKAVGAAEAVGGQWGAAKAVGWEVGVQPRLWGGKWGCSRGHGLGRCPVASPSASLSGQSLTKPPRLRGRGHRCLSVAVAVTASGEHMTGETPPPPQQACGAW